MRHLQRSIFHTVSGASPYPDLENGVYEVLPLNGISPLWEAGSRLAQKNADDRMIFTYVDKDQDGVVDWPYLINGSTNNQDDFPRTSPMQGPIAWSIEHIFTSSFLVLIILVLLGISIRHQRKNRDY